ncbi:relaxase/mobilization nuclease domain-containing protein [Aureimonas sp. D3]|uniref:relaxase/mobilization nuclease domain-containing protein n=1 Tax=Aureimonas sp. D3 TaxID=1638164 RepID=UPI0012E397C3|nr:relaxase/mobilization nuclease domain-containing protein [Aureimonas sp. D3]
MLIKFFPRGQGSGAGPVGYVLRLDDREHSPPKVLRGDPDTIRDLIDAIDRQWRYTSGVVSFALEDAPSEAQQNQVMDEFERTAFAGLESDQYAVLWVRHSHTEGGRVELHFVTPRMELASGRAFNIAPPGWQSLYGTLQNTLNGENRWADPHDPARARDRHVTLEAPERARDREAVHTMVEGWIEHGLVRDRAEIVAALQETGLEIPRQSKSFITVLDPDSGERFRLKGTPYEEGWTASAQLEPAYAAEDQRRHAALERASLDDRDDAGRRAEAARTELEERIRARAERHAELYGRSPVRDEELQRLLETGRSEGREPHSGEDDRRSGWFASDVLEFERGSEPRDHTLPVSRADDRDLERDDPSERRSDPLWHDVVGAYGPDPDTGSTRDREERTQRTPTADEQDRVLEHSEGQDDASAKGNRAGVLHLREPPMPEVAGELGHGSDDPFGARASGFAERLAEIARATNQRFAGWIREATRFLDGWLRERDDLHHEAAGRSGALADELGQSFADGAQTPGRDGRSLDASIRSVERCARELGRNADGLEREAQIVERQVAQEIEQQRQRDRERDREYDFGL